MKKILIIAAVIDWDEPDDREEQPVRNITPSSPLDTLLRRFQSEVQRNPDIWKDFNGTFLKG